MFEYAFHGRIIVVIGRTQSLLLIVDRSLKPINNKIVIAVLNGDLTVKRLKINDGRYILVPENKNFAPIQITQEMDFSIWGVVTSVIHEL